MFNFLVLITLILRLAFVGAAPWGITHTNATAHTNSTTHSAEVDKRGIAGTIELTDIYGLVEMYVIPYCYANPTTRQQLGYGFEASIRQWMVALGSPASAQTQHAISVYETLDGQNQPVFCYSNYQSIEQPGTWNNGIWKLTLAIHYIQQWHALATLGFDPRQAPGGHHLYSGLVQGNTLRNAMISLTHQLTHELGHVFGLVHEHQRLDRDSQIHINWDKIAGYREAIAETQRRVPAMTMQQAHDRLPTSETFSRTMGSGAAVNYIIWPFNTPIGSYDFDSIMYYRSLSWARNMQACTPQNTQEYAITGISEAFIPARLSPSQGDAYSLRTMYPYSLRTGQ
ncbi:zincin [Karstenula rhodostoma CBS 690.94]|uniref:Metalloendopeptidase n=1 Tax=Karstenula rhodostoma CBS 690.94 TaxID=1392251 RepID=A0A9P4UFY8_9PLEO|nr:zincin [Karstenula rhodostoma CBS 690.94]